MHTLFTSTRNDLLTFFRSLPADKIRDCCSSAVYSRGEDYFQSDTVSQLVYNREKTVLKATVSGDDDYTVTIKMDNGSISGSCTCPYYDVCKHIVATLLSAAAKDADFEIERLDEKDAGNLFQQYLQGLSKDELAALVEKFASDQFRKEVINRYANAGTAKKTFRKVELKIRKLFDNDNLMYSPDEFSEALDNEMEKLSGLEKSLKSEIEGLLFYIIKRVDAAFNDGYLYDDYNDNSYDTSLRFDEFVVRYVISLNSSEKTNFLAKLDTQLEQQSYSSFEYLINVAKSVFAEEDLLHLKNVLMTCYQDISPLLVGIYYDHVSGMLSYNEKTVILNELHKDSETRAVELAVLHDTHGHLSKAIETLKVWLKENRKPYHKYENGWSLYLDLLMKGKQDITEIAADAIINCSTDTMLSKVISITDSNPARYELLLEKENTEAMLRYLQKKERLPEALDLINRYDNIPDNQVLNFFKEHKKMFPKDATNYFGRVIDKNLESTGNRYYEAIADAVRHLAKVNRAKADEYIHFMRKNYNRRRNLMSLLNEISM